MAKKVYIGYDLGNAETYASLYKAGDEKPVGIKLPSANNNTAPILTGYLKTEEDECSFGDSIIEMYKNPKQRAKIKEFKMGFKEKPSDLIEGDFKVINQQFKDLNTDMDDDKVLDIFYNELTLSGRHLQEVAKDFCVKNIKTECPNKFSGLLSLQNDVKVFTDMIFENKEVKDTLSSQFKDVSEIVFSVGYPSNWDERDEAIYRDCFEQSVIGIGTFMGVKASLRLYKEAEAAYRSKNIENNKNCLIMDIGSSTIDVSWTDNKGEPHFKALKLGARTFEYIIKKDVESLEFYHALDYNVVRKNNNQNVILDKIFLYSCRKGKEEIFREKIKYPNINNPYDFLKDFSEIYGLSDIKYNNDPRYRDYENLKKMTEFTPGAYNFNFFDVFINQENDLVNMKTIFMDFLDEIEIQNIDKIILTGSASQMPFIQKYIEERNKNIISDDSPASVVADGLCLAAYEEDIKPKTENKE